MEVREFINGKVEYDENGGQYFWINEPDGSQQMLAMMRGWGHIQHMFDDKKGKMDLNAAGEFQDKVGKWVAEAINEKLEREKK